MKYKVTIFFETEPQSNYAFNHAYDYFPNASFIKLEENKIIKTDVGQNIKNKGLTPNSPNWENQVESQLMRD